MEAKKWGNEYRSTAVCVDSYDNGVLAGRIYNPYLAGGVGFRSVMEFLTRMEDLLDQMQFPQSFAAMRPIVPIPE